MSEEGWRQSNDVVGLMARAERSKLFSNRKKRLLGCAYCRRAWHFITEPRWQEVVDVLERFSDRQATRDDVKAAVEAANKTEGQWGNSTSCRIVYPVTRTLYFAKWSDINGTAGNARCAIRDSMPEPDGWEAMEAEAIPQAELVREVIGNPNHPVVVEKSWLTRDVKTLAKAIYEERTLPAGALDPVRLAILADALEDAGCTNRDILDHCRSPGPHVRGCWVIDLLLGKK
jgi:hypothetical protein